MSSSIGRSVTPDATRPSNHGATSAVQLRASPPPPPASRRGMLDELVGERLVEIDALDGREATKELAQRGVLWSDGSTRSST